MCSTEYPQVLSGMKCIGCNPMSSLIKFCNLLLAALSPYRFLFSVEAYSENFIHLVIVIREQKGPGY